MDKRVSNTFHGAKLRLARTFRGWTQVQLAQELAVTHPIISQIEVGQKQPSIMMLNAFCDALGFESEFFYEPLVNEFRDENTNFRRRQTTPLAVRSRVLAHGTLFDMLVAHLDLALRLPASNVPQFQARHREEIERIAEKCRLEWGVGMDLPIRNMCRVLERAGVVVTKFETSTEKVDAFSHPGKRHVIVLATDKGSTSRTRFDIGHETGHLVIHQGVETGTPETEEQADQFSSAFLLPRTGFLREFPVTSPTSRLDWELIFRLKQRWKVSAAAIVRRAYDLKRIDAVQYQRAYKYIHAQGWHRGEPHEPEPEEPELIPKSFDFLIRRMGHSFQDVGKRLYWKPEVLERVTGIPIASSALSDPLDPDEQWGQVIPIELYLDRIGKEDIT